MACPQPYGQQASLVAAGFTVSAAGTQHCIAVFPHALASAGSSASPCTGTLSSRMEGLPRDSLRVLRPAVIALFNELVDLLTGSGRKQ